MARYTQRLVSTQHRRRVWRSRPAPDALGCVTEPGLPGHADDPVGTIDELEGLRQQFRLIKSDANTLIAGLSQSAFNWRRESAAWSMGQCLEHLNVTTRAYLPRLDESIEQARRQRCLGPGPYRYGWLQMWFVQSMEPPVKRRSTAPKVFRPQSVQLPLAETLNAFLSCQGELVVRLHEARAIDLRRATVRSPVIPLVRFSLGIAFAMMAAHERRHIWQARQVRDVGEQIQWGATPACES